MEFEYWESRFPSLQINTTLTTLFNVFNTQNVWDTTSIKDFQKKRTLMNVYGLSELEPTSIAKTPGRDVHGREECSMLYIYLSWPVPHKGLSQVVYCAIIFLMSTCWGPRKRAWDLATFWELNTCNSVLSFMYLTVFQCSSLAAPGP